MNCQKCGQPLSTGWHVCGHCGAPVGAHDQAADQRSAAPAYAHGPANPPPQAGQPHFGQQPQYVQPPPARAKVGGFTQVKLILIGVGALIFLGFLGLIVVAVVINVANPYHSPYNATHWTGRSSDGSENLSLKLSDGGGALLTITPPGRSPIDRHGTWSEKDNHMAMAFGDIGLANMDVQTVVTGNEMTGAMNPDGGAHVKFTLTKD